MNKPILIGGAGFTGAVIARELAEAGYQVEVRDTRTYIAGNCYTERDSETNIMVHVHGPHIFHTDNLEVWDYINKFGKFENYIARIKATTQGQVFSLPINLHTINQYFNKTMNPTEAKVFIENQADKSIGHPISFEDQALKFLGERLYKAFFFGYPIKQWGIHPKELPASVLKRLPIRFNYDDNYFYHKFQGIPLEGYSEIVQNILNHENITVYLNKSVSQQDKKDYQHIFFSGPLDSWFNYTLGELGYRTLDFERKKAQGDFQGCAVMSYPEDEYPYTRISEHKHFTPWEEHQETVVFYEYSRQAKREDIPYYPIRLVEEKNMLSDYIALAEKERGVSFVGRLGTYRYLDMDVTIEEALLSARKFIECSKMGTNCPVFFKDIL